MRFRAEVFLTRPEAFAEILQLIESNPRYVFRVVERKRFDRRTKKGKNSGAAMLRHKRHDGKIHFRLEDGFCFAIGEDRSGGSQLLGAWISWLARNASDRVLRFLVRFEPAASGKSTARPGRCEPVDGRTARTSAGRAAPQARQGRRN